MIGPRSRSLAVSWLALLAGCSGPPVESDGGIDATTGLDAGETRDAGHDAARQDALPPTPGYVGAPCRSDADCRRPVDECIVDPIDDFIPVPDGYCTTHCLDDSDCAGQSRCHMGYGICLASCGETEGDRCPPGLGCQPFLSNLPDLPRHCFPGCEDDSDCDDGLTCAVGSGFFGTGLCIDPSRPLGGACETDTDCPPEAICGFGPGGSCELPYCQIEPESGCPDDARCVSYAVCLDGCTTDADCRPGYECGETSIDPGRFVCLEAFVTANLGQPCDTEDACPGGTCFTEGWTRGFPGGYCAAFGCDVVAQTGCPGDGVCIDEASSSRDPRRRSYCLDGCTSGADCRSGYDCLPSRPSDATSPLACMPACTSDADCTGASPTLGAHVCNVGAGTCGPPFDPALLGQPCLGPGACDGGTCIEEAMDGWPGGACVLAGCRLSGSGRETPCPAGGACADDEAGDPEFGVCVTACASPTDCRAGYACEAGACVPACGPSDCTGGRTCDVSTGLCEG